MLSLRKLVILAGTATAWNVPSYGGSGPYKAYYFEEESLQNYTLYQPLQSGAGNDCLKLPVIVWGNGGCATSGLEYRSFLTNVASQGALVIAVGTVFDDGSSGSYSNRDFEVDTDILPAAVDWVEANAGKGNYSHVDGSRIAAWGQSCGGLQAYSLAFDDRVSHLGIFNSGQLDDSIAVEDISKPVFYLLGGPEDIAWENGKRDYANLTAPKWLGNNGLGHIGTFQMQNGGPSGEAGKSLVQWLLRGDTSARSFFTEDAAGFTDVETAGLGEIKVSPIGKGSCRA